VPAAGRTLAVLLQLEPCSLLVLCALCVRAVLLMLCRAVLTLLAVLQEIAEVLEKEGDKEESIMFYEQAGDLFSTENSTAEANKCNLKVWRVGMRKEGRILHSQCLTLL
jgi:hypothetical protein